jgi:hypothetical protein
MEAQDQAEVIDMKAFHEHGVLAGDHVVVVVLGEVHAKAVGGFGGLAVADVVGEDEEIFGDVEGLTGAEEDVGEDGVEEGVGVAAGAVQEEDGVVGVAIGAAVGFAEGDVVEVQLLDRLAVFEVEVGDVVGAVLGGPFAWSGLRVGGCGRGREEREEDEAGDHCEGVSMRR